MRLQEVKKALRKLTPDQLRKLDNWLHELIDAEEVKAVSKHSPTARSGKRLNKTYQSQRVRCGKENCKCSRGELHGPYWYAYWTEGGKTRSEYVGKKLPRGVRKT